MRVKPGDLCAVHWLDTMHESDLTEHEARALKPVEVISYGRLLIANDSKVTVCGVEFADGELREVSAIPTAVVISIRKIKEVKL